YSCGERSSCDSPGCPFRPPSSSQPRCPSRIRPEFSHRGPILTFRVALMSTRMKLLPLSLLFSLVSLSAIWADDSPKKAAQPAIKVATFDVDATPPLGSAMAYDPVRRLDELTLRCRGIVITGAGKPIILCAVDWIGIANEGH